MLFKPLWKLAASIKTKKLWPTLELKESQILNWKNFDDAVVNLSKSDFVFRSVACQFSVVHHVKKLKTREFEFNSIEKISGEDSAFLLNLKTACTINLNEERVNLLWSGLDIARITTLNLRCVNLNDDQLATIVKLIPNSKLKSLDMQTNQITDEGVACLAEVLVLPQCNLKELNLDDNPIAEKSYKVLGLALPRSKLELLSIKNFRPAKTVDMKYIIEALPKCKLKHLNWMKVDAKELAEAIAKNVGRSKLEYLSFDISVEYFDMVLEALCSSQVKELFCTAFSLNHAEIFIKYLTKLPLTTLELLTDDYIGMIVSKLTPQSKITSIRTYTSLYNGYDERLEIFTGKNLEFTNISDLNILGGSIGDEQLAEFAKELVKSRVRTLIVRDLKAISLAGLFKFIRIIQKSKVVICHIWFNRKFGDFDLYQKLLRSALKEKNLLPLRLFLHKHR
ncbi:hypothetical protein HK103_002057 [Boothiomyces macroporosus]|uniref:Uncharacterized protein n=1 Tax=Boothiomyces macroporosus TaxID=261099 RepID=A0AAD5Y2Q3_9FUNG|nr:hypothetical protein HK103_002057 [Boothiomyces macroporosus]